MRDPEVRSNIHALLKLKYVLSLALLSPAQLWFVPDGGGG
jgi:hypothetical protein